MRGRNGRKYENAYYRAFDINTPISRAPMAVPLLQPWRQQFLTRVVWGRLGLEPM